MIDTTDLDSYYPGYEEYCRNNEETKPNPDDDTTIDDIIDEMILEKINEKESE